MAQKFKPGDMVKLMSAVDAGNLKNTSIMTVAEYRHIPVFRKRGKKKVYCVWFEGLESKGDIFPEEALQLIRH
jgi:uncharacterized protein YodC (DUF2158 family)